MIILLWVIAGLLVAVFLELRAIRTFLSKAQRTKAQLEYADAYDGYKSLVWRKYQAITKSLSVEEEEERERALSIGWINPEFPFDYQYRGRVEILQKSIELLESQWKSRQ